MSDNVQSESPEMVSLDAWEQGHSVANMGQLLWASEEGAQGSYSPVQSGVGNHTQLNHGQRDPTNLQLMFAYTD